VPNIIYIAETPQEIRIGRSRFTYEYGTIRQVNNWYRGQLEKQLREMFNDTFKVVPRGQDPVEFLKEWEAEQKPKRGRKAAARAANGS